MPFVMQSQGRELRHMHACSGNFLEHEAILARCTSWWQQRLACYDTEIEATFAGLNQQAIADAYWYSSHEQQTKTHIILMAIFQVNLGFPVSWLLLEIMSFGTNFYRPDALPHANQQKYTWLHLYCIQYNS